MTAAPLDANGILFEFLLPQLCPEHAVTHKVIAVPQRAAGMQSDEMLAASGTLTGTSPLRVQSSSATSPIRHSAGCRATRSAARDEG